MAEIGHGGGGSPINVKVVQGSNDFNLLVPPHSTFGEVKSLIAQQTGLQSKQQKLLFRGIEREDEEYLDAVGVKDNAKILLMEIPATKETEIEEIKTSEPSNSSLAIADSKPEVSQISEELDHMENTRKGRKTEDEESKKISRGCAEVAEVRGEVDKLAQKVTALEQVIDGGTKVEQKEFIVLSELLMRQLLKLDSIEAEGEGKVQRKLEVRRVQNLVDKVDSLKTVNSIPFINSSKDVSVTTTWETFDSGTASLPAPSSMSSTKATQDGTASLPFIRPRHRLKLLMIGNNLISHFTDDINLYLLFFVTQQLLLKLKKIICCTF